MKRWTKALHQALAVLRGGGAAVLAAFIVVACGGGDGPPDQTPAQRDAITGTVTSGDTSGAGEVAFSFAAKGTAGALRTANGMRGVLDYEVSLTQLTGPYVLRAQVAIGDADATAYYSVAPSSGTANITPLTTLIVAQLFGAQPSTIFNGFGAGSVIDTSLITAANLQAAQDKVIAFVRDETGYTIPAVDGNFVTTPFRAVAGDPAYAAITGLAQRLATTNTSFQTLTNNLLLTVQQCLTEKISIAVGSAVVDFCPESKTSIPRDADPTLIDYGFVDRRGNRLELAIRGDIVASVTYTTASSSYTCSGAGCSTVALGTPAGDLTRTITFNGLALQGASGGAVLNGTLTGAIPGIALPILPCSNNRFIMVFADRSTVGRCVDNPDPFGNGVSLPGLPNSDYIGVTPTRAVYSFGVPNGEDPTSASVRLITDENNAVVGISFADVDPDTSLVRRRYVCKAPNCNGTITYGPSTLNTDAFGPSIPFYIRTVTFADVVLDRVDENGVPTGETATLKSASFTTAYNPRDPASAYPTLAACAVGEETLASESDSAMNFNGCLQPGVWGVSPDDAAVANFSAYDANFATSVNISIRNEVLTNVSLTVDGISGSFACVGACPGVSVSLPDGSGVRTVTFTDALVNELFFGQAVFGPRSLKLNGTLTFTLTP